MPPFEVTVEETGDTREWLGNMASLPNGNLIVSWEQFSGGATASDNGSAGIRIVQPDGTAVTGEFFADINNSDRNINPKINVIDNDTFILTYQTFSFSPIFTSEVYGRVITLTGTTLSTGPEVLMAGGTSQTYGSHEVHITDNGNVVLAVAQMGPDETPPAVTMLRVFDAGLAPIDQGGSVGTGFTQVGVQNELQPGGYQIDSSGTDLWMSWNQNSDSNTSTKAYGAKLTVNANGTLANVPATEVLLREGTNGGSAPSVSSADIVLLANGDILFLSVGKVSTGGSLDDSDNFYGQIWHNALTATSGSEFQVNHFTDANGVSSISGVALDGGGFVVFWSMDLTASSPDGTREVWYQVYDNSYAASGAPVNMTNTGAPNVEGQSFPVLLSADGDFAVLVEETTNFGDDEDLRVFSLSDLDPNPIVPANAAPTITSGIATLTQTDEDTDSTATQVSSILTNRSFSDTDSGDSQGLAVTATTGNGNWQYSANGVTGWTNFGAVSDASSLLLSSTMFVRYDPDNIDGETATFTFRGWDQTTGTNLTKVATTTNGGTSAFSSATATTSIPVIAINDEPTLTVTGANPNANEQTNTALFSTVAADTVETGQTLTGMTVTITNLADGADEILRIDGNDVALTDANSLTTGTNSLTVSVSVSGTMATLTASNGTLSETAMQTLVDGMMYRNDSDTPTDAANRVVTITSLTDSGLNSGDNDNTASLNLTSTVTVVPVNDDPTATGLPLTETAEEDTAADVDLSALIIADVDETGDMSLIITATDGTLTGATSGGVVAVLSNANQTLTLTGTVAELNTYLDTASNIQYTGALNDNGTPADSLTVSVNDLDGSGAVLVGTVNVNINDLDDAPTLTATGLDPDHQGGTASNLFSTADADTIEVGQTLSSMTLTVSNLADGADETLTIDGTVIALTDGTTDTTATNTLNVAVSVAATTATVTITGGTLTEAALQILVDDLAYTNTSATPTLSGDRVVTLTELVDSGSNIAPNENTATLNLASTIAVVEAGSLIVTIADDLIDPFDGETSLREAIAFANSDPDQSDITFDPIVFADNATISIATDYAIDTDIFINGDSDADGDGDVTINGTQSTHMFSVTGASTQFSLEKITLTEGMTTSEGGAIDLVEGDLTLTDTIFHDNEATLGGGAIIARAGTITVKDSTFSDNTTGSGSVGGAIDFRGTTLGVAGSQFTGNSAGNSGGAIDAVGAVTIETSTFSGNTSGAVGGGAVAAQGISLDIIASMFSDNTAIDFVNPGSGGAVLAAVSDFEVTNASFVNNTGTNGSAIFTGSANSDLTNVTITGGSGGAAIHNFSVTTLNLTNGLIVGNNGAAAIFNQDSSASNVLTSVTTGLAADVFAALDPVTGGGLLADNGGPLQTVALREDAANPALDIGLNSAGLLTDANGDDRTIDLPGVGADLMGFVDAGAVELQALGDLTVSLAATEINETDGAGATTGTVTRSGASTTLALTVTLTSSDPSEATVPETVIIGAGETTATFDVAAVDDGVTDGQQTVTITASADAINYGSETLIVIENQPPTITLDPETLELPEDIDVTARIKLADVVIADDGIGTNNLSIRGADSGSFEVIGTELFLRAGAVLDFEREPELDVFVDIDDPAVGVARDDTATFTLELTDVNEAPEVSVKNVTANLPEDADTTSAIKVADIEIDDDALGTNLLSLSGADAGLFSLVGDELFLDAGAALDFETQASLAVTVAVDDGSVGGAPDDSVDLNFNITDINEAPTVSVANVIAGVEETTFLGSRVKVADVVITDDALGSETLSLQGPNKFIFQLDGNELFIKSGQALDFETDHPISVEIAVDDPTLGTGIDDTVTATLNLLDLNEAPTLALENVISGVQEDTTARTKIADIVITDDALGTNTLGLSGADAGLFEIDGVELFLSAGASLDAAVDPSLNVTVTLDDTEFVGLEGSEAVALIVADVNDPPTVVLLNPIAELSEDTDTTARVKVADIDVTDDALGTATLGLTGADAALFEIDGTELFLSAGVVLDFETDPGLTVDVTVDDPALGGTPDDSAALALAVTDVNEAPTLNLENIVTDLQEDTIARTKVADIVISDDALGTNTLALTGADAGLFEIDGDELFLAAGTALDFESDPQLDVIVTLDDAEFAGLEGSEAVELLITDVNEAPTVALLDPVTGLSEDTDTAVRVKVADIDVSDDALGTATLGLVGADAALFEIDGTELFLSAGVILDHESNPSLDVSVTVDDPAFAADPDDSTALVVAVTDVNEAPALALLNVLTGVAEDTTARTKIADIVVSDDALGTNTLALTGADAALFEIDGTGLFLSAGGTLDFESDTQLDVTVTLDDTDFTGLEGSEAVTLAVTDVNEPPILALLNALSDLSEGTDTTTRIKVADIDVTDDALGTTILGLTGADASLFEIDGNELFLIAGATLDFETNPSLDVEVTVDDPALAADPDASAALALAITDANEAPSLAVTQNVTDLTEDSDTTTRTAVATIAITDDALGTNMLALTGDDAALFEIDAGVLYLGAGAALDHSANPTLDVSVTLDDATLGADIEDFASLSINVSNAQPSGTPGDDLLIGTPLTDVLEGLAGNDTLVGLGEGDILDGGEGTDTAVLATPQDSYTITFGAGGTIVSDGSSTDTLIDIETLRFSDDPEGAPDIGDTLNLTLFAGVLDVTEAQLEGLTLLYIGLFDRAPDALGLFFWATKLANGTDMESIGQSFLNGDEAATVFGGAPSTAQLVDAAYENLLDRTADAPGANFWTNLINFGLISEAEFFTKFAAAAISNDDDSRTLSDQLDIALYYSAIKGLSDKTDASTALAAYDIANRDTSLQDAQALVDGYVLDIENGTDPALLMNVSGILDDPFSVA